MNNTTTRRFALIALPVASAGLIGAAAIGLAGAAHAGTYPTHDPSPRPGIVAVPTVKAQPPILQYPGKRWDHIVVGVPGAE
jgi:hypothetical protein